MGLFETLGVKRASAPSRTAAKAGAGGADSGGSPATKSGGSGSSSQPGGKPSGKAASTGKRPAGKGGSGGKKPAGKGSGLLARKPRNKAARAAGPLQERRRRLVASRDTTLRDLGGLMLEMYKRNRFREELLLDKCEEVLALEVEVAHIDQRLFQLSVPNTAGQRPIGRCECGATILPGQNFCAVCGRGFATLTQKRSCARCGSGLRPGDTFCGSCGTKAPDVLDALAAAQPPATAQSAAATTVIPAAGDPDLETPPLVDVEALRPNAGAGAGEVELPADEPGEMPPASGEPIDPSEVAAALDTLPPELRVAGGDPVAANTPASTAAGSDAAEGVDATAEADTPEPATPATPAGPTPQVSRRGSRQRSLRERAKARARAAREAKPGGDGQA